MSSADPATYCLADAISLYDNITSSAPEYYPFADELNLIKNHGHEIASAMGFPSEKKDDETYQNMYPRKEGRWRPARWGDAALGRWNNGVNGEEGLASGHEAGWDIVELGAGALRKTAHFLTAVADTVPSESATPPVTYHALDLSRPELERVLGQMDEQFGSAFSGRIASVGLHADYFAGLELVRDGGLAALSSGLGSPQTLDDEPGIAMSPASTLSHDLMTPALEMAPLPPSVVGDDEPVRSPEMPAKMFGGTNVLPSSAYFRHDASDSDSITQSSRPLHVMFLGSSLGNFDREDAGPFLKSIPLKQGDTILLGLDGRPAPGAAGRRKVEIAYNDPSGHTRAFEEHGWDVAVHELGLPMPSKDAERTVEFVGRYNETLGELCVAGHSNCLLDQRSRLGRHEAYYRSKKDQKIHLPEHDTDVELKEGELLHIEWSYKVRGLVNHCIKTDISTRSLRL